MKLADLIFPTDVVLGLHGRDVGDAASQLLSRTLPHRGFGPAEVRRLIDAVLAREREMPTTCGTSAIPHARDGHVASFVAAVGVNAKGIVDGQPDLRVIVAFLSPEEKRTEHLALLASISRMASSEAVVNALAAAKTAEDVVAILRR